MSTRIRRRFKKRLKGRQGPRHAEGEEEEAPQEPPRTALRTGELFAFALHTLSGGRRDKHQPPKCYFTKSMFSYSAQHNYVGNQSSREV